MNGPVPLGAHEPGPGNVLIKRGHRFPPQVQASQTLITLAHISFTLRLTGATRALSDQKKLSNCRFGLNNSKERSHSAQLPDPPTPSAQSVGHL